MKKLLATTLFLSLLGCAQKGKVVYIPQEKNAEVKEYCYTEGVDEVCVREIYKKVYVEKKSEYEREKEETLLKLLNPPTPVKAPDKILMIYVLPWVDEEGNFHAGEYLFLKVEEGEWVLEKTKENSSKVKVLTPLEVKK